MTPSCPHTHTRKHNWKLPGESSRSRFINQAFVHGVLGLTPRHLPDNTKKTWVSQGFAGVASAPCHIACKQNVTTSPRVPGDNLKTLCRALLDAAPKPCATPLHLDKNPFALRVAHLRTHTHTHFGSARTDAKEDRQNQTGQRQKRI